MADPSRCKVCTYVLYGYRVRMAMHTLLNFHNNRQQQTREIESGPCCNEWEEKSGRNERARVHASGVTGRSIQGREKEHHRAITASEFCESSPLGFNRGEHPSLSRFHETKDLPPNPPPQTKTHEENEYRSSGE
mmetsp:Transcript_11700/g.27076  ORF Transcript_11700/g.27076 Transcript_11700/m.27076 type:complete len:134 (+) Transcript_11700:774-1175(+)